MFRCSFLLAPLLALGLALAAQAAPPRNYQGVVTHVSDGDTLWVRAAAGGAPRPLRLDGIDAPEICQTWGPQSRAALAARVLHRPVAVQVRGRDSYRRSLAQVRLSGEDLAGWMVGQGHAWSYRFRSDPGPHTAEERLARQARRGLWASSAPTEPRLFRRRHGRCERD